MNITHLIYTLVMAKVDTQELFLGVSTILSLSRLREESAAGDHTAGVTNLLVGRIIGLGKCVAQHPTRRRR